MKRKGFVNNDNNEFTLKNLMSINLTRRLAKRVKEKRESIFRTRKILTNSIYRYNILKRNHYYFEGG